MKKAITAAVLVAAASTAANAAELLLVDLTVPNQVTVSATSGNSSTTVSGSDFSGILLSGFYNGNQTAALGTPVGVGNLVPAAQASDLSPSMFRGTNDPGLNIWDMSTVTTVSFTAGSLAFTGSATWTLSAAQYADMLGGNLTGTVLFPADTTGDPGVSIGEWRVIPTPGAASLLGVGLFAAARRRRA